MWETQCNVQALPAPSYHLHLHQVIHLSSWSDNMNVFPAFLLFWGLLPGSGATCTTAYGDKIRYCKAFQTDYIEGIEILIFEVRDVGRINSTLFSSPNLKSALSLTLKGSRIHTIESGAFQQFRGLSNIELQDNSLTALSPSWFHDPTTLRNLTLANNLLGRLRPEMLQGFSNLERLNLSRNQITSIHSESFLGVTKMLSLDLSYNRISSVQWQTLSPLNGTLRLGGNPWNCSCAHRDFILFMKEMMNASRLADPTSVTCRSPPDLIGAFVWNVTEMNCSSPALLPTPEAVFHRVVLPVLFVVLVLFLFILLIFLLWKKKQDQKQVQPDKRTKGEANTGTKGRSTMFGGVVIMNPNLMGITTASNQNPLLLGRARSAAAILLQGEFNPTKRNEISKCTNALRGGHNPKDSSESNMEIWYYNSLHGKVYQSFNVHPVPLSSINLNSTPMEDTSTHTPVVSMGPVEEDDCSTKSTSNIDEPLVYLCMNTTREESNTTNPVKKRTTNKSHVIRRALSWPNVQYKKDSRASYEDFLKTLNISPKPITQQKSKKSFQKLSYGDHPDTIQVLEESQGVLGKVNIMKDPASGGPSKNKMVDIKNVGRQQGKVLDNKNVDRQQHSTARNVYQRSSNSRQTPRSPDSGVNGHGLPSRGSEAGSELRRTPDDDQLLENNEYNFIDLLHEVVENHGRWTRERWRQTQQQRMSSRTSPQHR